MCNNYYNFYSLNSSNSWFLEISLAPSISIPVN